MSKARLDRINSGTVPEVTETQDVAPAASPTAGPGVGVGPRELVVLISSVMAIMALGIDLMLPAEDDIERAFGLPEGENQASQVITFYFFGLAFAQLVFGPLADRFGRKRVLYLGVGLYCIGAVASALAPTFETLLAARVFWGVGAAAARVVATSIVRDRFEGDQMARVMSQVMAVFILVPVIAPTLGAAIIAIAPWRTLFWFSAACSLVIAVWSLRLRETLNPANVRPFSFGQAMRSYREALSFRVTLGYMIATVFIQAVFTMYLSTSKHIIDDIFGRDGQFPIIFGIVAAGFGVSAVINSRLVEKHGIDAMVGFAMRAEVILSLLLVTISIAGGGVPNFWLFMPVLALMLSLFMLLMPNLGTAAMLPVGHIAGSASAVTAAIRTGLGAMIATVLNRFITDSVTPFAFFACGLVIAMAITVTITKRGAAPLEPVPAVA